MRLILFLVIIGMAIVIYMRLRRPVSLEGYNPPPVISSDQAAQQNHQFVFISKGKLFLWTAARQMEQIHSAYIQEMTDRVERSKQLHGWKQNTGFGRSFSGFGDADTAADQVELQIVSAQFTNDARLIYFLKDRHVGGLFEYDVSSKKERRLLHKQGLSYEDLAINLETRKILCAQQQANGMSNIVLIGEEGEDYQQLTEGDTVDSCPTWIPGDGQKILYQSSGLARSPEGYLIAYGPSSIKMLDMESKDVSTVLEDPDFDFLQPRVDSAGNLYYIKRPYDAVKYDSVNFITDFLLFPFRLVRAVFHYLNFFSLMYSRKPLTSASGPKVSADIKDLLIKGKRIDADKALRKESRVNGIPSLVPKSWQLLMRTQEGKESLLATNVASFDLTSENTILYSNGYAVFQLTSERGSSVIVRDKLIADVIAS